MARTVDENFEGTGYEESWSETIDAGCTLDEDSTIPGTPPPGAGSQCLKSVVLNGTDNQAYATRTPGNTNINYWRQYIYLAEEGLSDTAQFFVNYVFTNAIADVCYMIIRQNSGIIQIRFSYYNGTIQDTAFVTISLNTWYRLEWQYDVTNLLWEWKINGVTQASGSLTTTRIPNHIRAGIISHTGSAQTTMYTDLVVWDNANWIGGEAGGLSIPVTLGHKILGRGILSNRGLSI